jgi:DNA processing protein
MKEFREQLPLHDLDQLTTWKRELEERHMGMLTPGDDRFPEQLLELKSPPSYLFYWGNLGLLEERGVGMCGSRHVSGRGSEAARACGEEVASEGWHVVSGYAKGVDTETHLAALDAGAGTVIVLAEGILNFRRKRVFDEVPFDSERVLVLSQFPPNQRWSVGGAMTRNGLIAALGEALVVVEAGEKGGTLNAGMQGLDLQKPVFALQFSDETPPGNQRLLDAGAQAVKTRRALKELLKELASRPAVKLQMALPVAAEASP